MKEIRKAILLSSILIIAIHCGIITASNNCGPEVLKIITDYYKIDTNEEEIKLLCGYSEIDGTTMLGILSAAKKLKLPAIAIKTTVEEIAKIKSPAIAYLDSNHYSICHGIDSNGYIKMQDKKNEIYTITEKEFKKIWNGELIIISKSIYEHEKKKESIFIDDKYMHWGVVQEGELLEKDIIIHNPYKETMVIRARSRCGCVKVLTGSIAIAPNETGILKVSFNTTGRIGHQKQIIDIMTSIPPKPHMNTYLLQQQ